MLAGSRSAKVIAKEREGSLIREVPGRVTACGDTLCIGSTQRREDGDRRLAALDKCAGINQWRRLLAGGKA